MSDEQYEALRKQYAELVNYISAMAREIGEFRAEARENDEKLRAEMKERFDKVEERLGNLEKESKKLREQVREMASDLLETRADVRLHEKRLDKLEEEAA